MKGGWSWCRKGEKELERERPPSKRRMFAVVTVEGAAVTDKDKVWGFTLTVSGQGDREAKMLEISHRSVIKLSRIEKNA